MAMWHEGFDGRVALVTGAAQGIGRHVADSLREQGARVAYLDLEAPADVRPGSEALAVAGDVRDQGQVDEAFAAVEAALGPVDILVNNAGVLRSSDLVETSLADWELSFAVNATGAFLTMRRALPGMAERGYGRIVNVGSSAGKNGGARAVGAYAASKAALMCLTKTAAKEHGSDGVTVNAVAPALIDTAMIDGLRDLADRIPVGRLGRTADVAHAILFLAAEDSAYITGEVLDVDGGFVID